MTGEPAAVPLSGYLGLDVAAREQVVVVGPQVVVEGVGESPTAPVDDALAGQLVEEGGLVRVVVVEHRERLVLGHDAVGVAAEAAVDRWRDVTGALHVLRHDLAAVELVVLVDPVGDEQELLLLRRRRRVGAGLAQDRVDRRVVLRAIHHHGDRLRRHALPGGATVAATGPRRRARRMLGQPGDTERLPGRGAAGRCGDAVAPRRGAATRGSAGRHRTTTRGRRA